ncbi:MAG: hypothetical protein HYU81_00470 [Candidatus Brennerbacteria bacterium]|nr:hypothetical protein [Candidatus Brennerbacteria bacterium]
MKPRIVVIILFIVLGGVALAGIFSFIGGAPVPADAAVADFAQCLATKGAVMYGTKTCPYCRAEKAAFGDAFRYIEYVECTETPNRCVDAGVQGVPLWTFADGTRREGAQGLEGLARASGCPFIPKNETSRSQR